jgi:S1-C subfamily serine protease
MKNKIAAILLSGLMLSSCSPKDVKLANRVVSSSYKIGVIIDKKGHEIYGSGTAIDRHHVLTCRHLFIMGHKKVFIKDYRNHWQQVKIERISLESSDLTLLYVDKPLPAYLAIATRQPERGSAAYSLGYPLAGPLNFCKGIITGLDDGYLLSDVFTTNGNSGGALLNDKGEIIGVTVMSTSREPGTQGICISESIKTITKFLDNIKYKRQ